MRNFLKEMPLLTKFSKPMTMSDSCCGDVAADDKLREESLFVLEDVLEDEDDAPPEELSAGTSSLVGVLMLSAATFSLQVMVVVQVRTVVGVVDARDLRETR